MELRPGRMATVAIECYNLRMARQSTLNVSLTPKLDEYVRAKVSGGEYESASEVVRESLRALQKREREVEAFWADVREKVAAGRRDVAEGRVYDGEQVMDEIEAELDALDEQDKLAAARRKPKKTRR